MKVLSRMTRNINKNIGTVLRKGVGIGALGLVVADAHKIGKMEADFYASERDAYEAVDYLNNYMYSTDMSMFTDKIKGAAYSMEIDQGWRRFFNTGIGYVKGFTSMLVSHVIPFGLGMGALLGKGALSKISCAGLGVYGAFTVIKNFFGFGTPNNPLQ